MPDTDPATPGRLPLSLLQRRGIEAEVLIPFIRRLEVELGSERAHQLARETIAQIARDQGRAVAEALGRSDLAGFHQVRDTWSGAGGDLTIDTLREDGRHLDFNVTRCRFAEMYERLDARDLGFVLSCGRDFTLSEGYSSGLELVRTQTIMEGAAYCDFRYRYRDPAPAAPGLPEHVEGSDNAVEAHARRPAAQTRNEKEGTMRIQIFGDDRESSLLERARELVDEAVAQAGVADAEVEVIAVHNDDEAKALRSIGAPTVRIDGFDAEYAEREPAETTAGPRYYSTPDGWQRLPERGMIVFAIKEAQARSARRQAAT